MDELVVGNVLDVKPFDLDFSRPSAGLLPEVLMIGSVLDFVHYPGDSTEVFGLVYAEKQINLSLEALIRFVYSQDFLVSIVKNLVALCSRTPNAILDCLVHVFFCVGLDDEELGERGYGGG